MVGSKRARRREEQITATTRQLADQMVAVLGAGLADPGWQPPWHAAGFSAGAYNVATGRKYRGGNWLMLSLREVADPGRFAGPWGTFAQWKSLGAVVVKGSKGTPIRVPWQVSRVDEQTGEERTWTTWRVFWVFAASQVSGWERPRPQPVDAAELSAPGREFIAAAGERFNIIEHDLPSAFYDPAADTIRLPAPGHFRDGITGWAGTLLHELTHLTGAPARLGRFSTDQNPTITERAREELVAELGAATLGHDLAITTGLRDDHRAYLTNWLQALQDKPAEIWEAATAASKATTWLHHELTHTTQQAA